MYLLNGSRLSYGRAFRDARGNQYPANWLELSTEEDRTRAGIEFAPDPVEPPPPPPTAEQLAAIVIANAKGDLAATDLQMARVVEDVIARQDAILALLVSKTVIAEEEKLEAISGLRCVNISQSGYARIAMAGVSGRMPVAGILTANVVSGTVLSPLSGNAPVVVGAILPTAGTLSTSGRFGLFLYCGMSGNVVTSVGVTSGVVAQRVGYGLLSGFMYTNIGQAVTSGLSTTFYGDF